MTAFLMALSNSGMVGLLSLVCGIVFFVLLVAVFAAPVLSSIISREEEQIELRRRQRNQPRPH